MCEISVNQYCELKLTNNAMITEVTPAQFHIFSKIQTSSLDTYYAFSSFLVSIYYI